MKCPACVEPHLVLAERQGIEIDYCPQCRGVWLDRGELDKLIEKSSARFSAPPAQPSYDPRPRGEAPRGEASHYRGEPQHYKKQKSWLHEIFD